jgi:dienelactone hydrolase
MVLLYPGDKTMPGKKSRRWWFAAILLLGLAPLAAGQGDDKNPAGPVKPKPSDAQFTSGGQTIKVWKYVPGEGTGPFPAIILLNGIDGLDLLQTDLKVQVLYRTVASKLSQQGYVVHFVHYMNRTPLKKQEIPTVKDAFLRQTQNSTENGPKAPDLEPKLEQHYREWVDTVRDAVKNLRENKDLVDGEHIALVGLSMGGFVAASTVVEYPDLKIVAIANIFGGMPPSQQDKVRKDKMKLPPLLIMGGEEDVIVPEFYQRQVFKLWRDTGNTGEAHFYAGYGHAFFDKRINNFDQNMALNEALPTTMRFLKRYLQKN